MLFSTRLESALVRLPRGQRTLGVDPFRSGRTSALSKQQCFTTFDCETDSNRYPGESFGNRTHWSQLPRIRRHDLV